MITTGATLGGYETVPQFSVILNWFEELVERVPVH